MVLYSIFIPSKARWIFDQKWKISDGLLIESWNWELQFSPIFPEYTYTTMIKLPKQNPSSRSGSHDPPPLRSRHQKGGHWVCIQRTGCWTLFSWRLWSLCKGDPSRKDVARQSHFMLCQAFNVAGSKCPKRGLRCVFALGHATVEPLPGWEHHWRDCQQTRRGRTWTRHWNELHGETSMFEMTNFLMSNSF